MEGLVRWSGWGIGGGVHLKLDLCKTAMWKWIYSSRMYYQQTRWCLNLTVLKNMLQPLKASWLPKLGLELLIFLSSTSIFQHRHHLALIIHNFEKTDWKSVRKEQEVEGYTRNQMYLSQVITAKWPKITEGSLYNSGFKCFSWLVRSWVGLGIVFQGIAQTRYDM